MSALPNVSEEKNEDIEEEPQLIEDNEEEASEKAYMDISELEQVKISTTDIKKLKDANFWTVESVVTTPKMVLNEIRGISDNKVDKIVEAGLLFEFSRNEIGLILPNKTTK